MQDNIDLMRPKYTKELYYKRDGVLTIEERILDIANQSTGFVNFNYNKYDWVYKLYRLMINLFWTTNEINTAGEKKNYENLSDDEKEIYKVIFASLSFLDSSQEEYILDFRNYVTNRNMKAMLVKHAETEVLHSDAYKVLLEKTGVSDEVFELHRTNDTIATKADRVATQFAKYISKASNSKNFLYSAIGSANLEGIYFLTGFSLVYMLGDKVPGARDMIKLIHRDEEVHLAVFANIIKTILREFKFTTKNLDQVYEEINFGVETELEFGKALIKDRNLLGLDEKLLEDTVKNFANKRLKAIGLEPIYDIKDKTFLEKLVEENRKLADKRENFFETNVSNYTKSTLDFEDF